MRLVFITDTLCSGGAERVVSILANSFSEKRHTEIICLRKMPIFYDIHPNVPVVFADDHGKGWLSKLMWLRNYINKEDIVIPFMVQVYCVTLIALLGEKINIIASERNDPKTTGQPWKFLRRLLLPKVQALVVQTLQIKDYFSDDIKKKIEIIMNPLDLKNCWQGDWNEGSKTVIAVGRTDSQKNYPMMIQSFVKLHEKHPDFHLEIWGNRHEKDKEPLQKLINDFGASEYICINGRTENMAELYSRAYMFIMSSDYEGLSNALIEALCSGLPVVSTKVSGAVDVINNGVNGLLVDIRDEKGFYQAMNQLIENSSKAKLLSGNARLCRSMFVKEKICGQWESLIYKVEKAKI